MARDLLFVVTDAEGFRVAQPVSCSGQDAPKVVRGLLAAIQALSVEVWRGGERLYAVDNLPAYELAA